MIKVHVFVKTIIIIYRSSVNNYTYRQQCFDSGGFSGGSRGSLEPPSGVEFFHFHGEFQNILAEIRQTNPPPPLFRNPGSAPL